MSVNLYDTVVKLTVQSHNIDQSSSSNLLGKYCKKLSINKDIFNKFWKGKKTFLKVCYEMELC